MKRVIKESQLRQIIRESLVSILNEHRVRQNAFPSIDEITGVQVYVADPSKCENAANRDPQRLCARFKNFNAIDSKVDDNGGVYAWFEEAGDAEEIWRECLGEPRFSPKVITLTRDVPLNQCCDNFQKYYDYWKWQYEQYSNNDEEGEEEYSADDNVDRDIDADYQEEENNGDAESRLKDDAAYGYFNDDDDYFV